jgi:hypothetical protein
LYCIACTRAIFLLSWLWTRNQARVCMLCVTYVLLEPVCPLRLTLTLRTCEWLYT